MRQLPLIPDGPSVPLVDGRTTNRFADGVFGWYQYVQDFTGQFALDWIDRLAREGDIIWEPFSGSGTTLVASKIMGLHSCGYDISPFMVDVATTKLDWTIPPQHLDLALERVLTQVAKTCDATLPESTRWENYDATIAITATYPDDPKLRRWISPLVLERFSHLLSSVGQLRNGKIRRFFRLAVAGILIPASNMVFRPNISYQRRPYLDYPVEVAFEQRARTMIHDYREIYGMSPGIDAVVTVGDARTDGPDSADLIFTSPPLSE